MTQRRGEDWQPSSQNNSAATLPVSRPTLSAACSNLPAIIPLWPSHQPSAAQPSAAQPSAFCGSASSHLRPCQQPFAAQPAAICGPTISHLWPSHPSSFSHPAQPSAICGPAISHFSPAICINYLFQPLLCLISFYSRMPWMQVTRNLLIFIMK